MQNLVPQQNLRLPGQLEILTINDFYGLRPLSDKDQSMQLTSRVDASHYIQLHMPYTDAAEWICMLGC